VCVWYSAGLRFTCGRCGACCRGEPGYVWVTHEEAVRIAAFMKISLDDFTRGFLRRVGRRTSLVEKANGDCCFWDGAKGCSIHPVRPVQCRTFPFWRANLESGEAWASLLSRCPGAGRGRLYTREEIGELAALTW